MDKATKKSIEWQKANNPMAIGGDAFADMVDSFNVNPAYIAGYKDAQKDLALTWEDIRSIIIINEKYTTMLLNSTPWDGIYTKTEYEEVLRRFNEQKNK